MCVSKSSSASGYPANLFFINRKSFSARTGIDEFPVYLQIAGQFRKEMVIISFSFLCIINNSESQL